MSDSFYTEYQYANGSTAHSTSNLISGVTQKLGEDSIVSYSYEYNDNEDVEYILEDGERVACYTYGDMNQLSYYADENTGIYKHFYYDNVGNITGVTDYRLLSYGWIPGSEIESHTYTYGDNNWKDKLTKYDNQTITYDENGNPLQYRDGMSFTWINGRILDTVSVDNDTIEMQYDYNGMRTQKGDTQYYYDSENRLIGMTKGSHTLLFYYDENGNPTAFTDNGTMYFYIRNLQGDIVKIVNSSGAVVVNYIYDALGKKLSVTDASDNEIIDLNSLALLNPLRYRGYVYDDETGLYYLQSRYYDPTIGRFINADILFDTASGTPLSTNMFAYCENNPISRADSSGNVWYYSLFDYAKYRDSLYKTYKSYDRYYMVNSYYRDRSNYYGTQYAIAKNRYRWISEEYYYNLGLNRSWYGYIYGQRNYPWGDFKFCSTTVYYEGCGAVALYNVMLILNRNMTLAQVILELELNMLLANNGANGTKNSAFSDFLKAHRITHRVAVNANQFVRYAKYYKVFLVTINGHAFCVIKRKGDFYALNRYDDDTWFQKFEPFKIKDLINIYLIG